MGRLRFGIEMPKATVCSRIACAHQTGCSISIRGGDQSARNLDKAIRAVLRRADLVYLILPRHGLAGNLCLPQAELLKIHGPTPCQPALDIWLI